ncbi:hypothetical protein, partial [Bartonella sp. AA1HLJMS]|uniref:hypothetical protein n=1 Tax=Bartonella sp. AA1HLJMS TaxID=3243424 RepID=UPI0035CF287E
MRILLIGFEGFSKYSKPSKLTDKAFFEGSLYECKGIWLSKFILYIYGDIDVLTIDGLNSF